MEIKRRKWQTLCTSEWPIFNVGWPRDGTFNITVILQVKERIFSQGPQGHPDQVPYIAVWESLIDDPPPWVSPFAHPKPKPLPDSIPSPIPSAPPVPLCPANPPKPPISSNLYPVIGDSASSRRPKPKRILPPHDSPLIDLLTEDPPPTSLPLHQRKHRIPQNLRKNRITCLRNAAPHHPQWRKDLGVARNQHRRGRPSFFPCAKVGGQAINFNTGPSQPQTYITGSPITLPSHRTP